MQALSESEQKFMAFWSVERSKPQSKIIFVMKGLRYGMVLVGLMILSLTTGWYKRIAFLSTGMLCTFFVACLLLLVFVSVFSAYYELEQNEQRYLELKQKMSQP